MRLRRRSGRSRRAGHGWSPRWSSSASRAEQRADRLDVAAGDGGEVPLRDRRRTGITRGEPVERRGVLAEHLRALRRPERRDCPPERGHRTGERGVVVRIVGSPHDAVGADEREQRRKGGLVHLVADPALAREVLARPEPHLRAETTEGLGLLVESLEPERGPATSGLQEDEPESRVAFEHAEGDELREGEHLLEAVRDRRGGPEG